MNFLNFIDHPLVGTPYGAALDLCIVLAIASWVLSILTREYSWVDRLWSVVPAVYCLIVAVDLEFRSVRVTVMTMLATVWAIRLTFNHALKGGYWIGGEDYRWIYVRKQMSSLQFQLMNVVVVAIGQMAVVWLFTSPIHQAWVYAERPMGWLDFVAIQVFLVLLTFESIADAQMWQFQQNKKRLIKEGVEVERPFMDGGLFRFCRHPSYFCEMGMWVTFYVFAISASGQFWHWTGLGCVLLILVFQGSTRLAEQISSEKYPAYSNYQASVPKLIPFTRLGCIPEE
ncbi:MAG: DUF1295 domain-containing protein [Acidobacteria bacterium]|nr:DUF1295 domain-containing protein [Acidobacteriota bacterium]